MQNLPEAQNILSKMTVKELRDIAREVHKAANGVTISGYSKMVKAELVRQLSFEDAWYFADMYIDYATVDGPEASAEEVEAATREHEDEEIDLSSTINGMIEGWLPEEVKPEPEADESTVDALVTRDAPGLAFVNLGTAENNVAAVRRIRNRYELLTNSGDVIRAGSIAKAVKRWAKRNGITVNRIETVKQF